jgi:MFS family permease
MQAAPPPGDHPTAEVGSRSRGRVAGMRLVLLFGVVSFFADMTYEGGRSIVGPYLAILGASATAVGVVAGGGELLGYALRLFSGRLADSTRAYWPITIAGYVLQMAAVPALALAGSWELAAVLIVAERVGKAVRNPPRDAMLAHAGSEMGRGWAFGVHEAMDQVGALAGPLVAAAVLAMHGRYEAAFALLAIPAVLTLATLGVARLSYPDPTGSASRPVDAHPGGLPRAFWIYVAGAGLVAAGFADFSLMAFHFEKASTVSASLVPIFYSAAMGASGLGSLVFGRLFDRRGIVVLVPLSAGAARVALLWGVGMGVHESVMAAAVAEMVPSARIASAYGLFNLLYGVAWFVGSALMGVLYDVSVPALVIFSVAVELAAIPVFIRLRRSPGLAGPAGLGGR